jgi:hypothetical protein
MIRLLLLLVVIASPAHADDIKGKRFYDGVAGRLTVRQG